MNNLLSLFQCILFGEFGLFTLTPRYLFLVLFPVLILLGFLRRLLPVLPFIRQAGPRTNQLFYSIAGLGCTTVALASLTSVHNQRAKRRMALILTLLIPCSAQLTMIAAFAAMVSLPVFLVFLLFFFVFSFLLYQAVSLFYPFTDRQILPCTEKSSFHPGTAVISSVKEAFRSICETAPAFCAGSVFISTAAFCGLFHKLIVVLGPLLNSFFRLPEEAAELLILNLLKRDFGAASLLSFTRQGVFDGAQLIIVVLMMVFSAPCFNSSILLIKQQKLPAACLIWLGSFLLSLLIGKIVSEIFFICLFQFF